jgi:hypothetical protein
MMESFLSILPKGFFNRNDSCGGMIPSSWDGGQWNFSTNWMLSEDKGRKRVRGGEGLEPKIYGVLSTPKLTVDKLADLDVARPAKRARLVESRVVQKKPVVTPYPPPEPTKEIDTSKCYIQQLPDDLIAHCLSFSASTNDRYALQCTSKQFKRLSNTDEMLIGIEVGGDRSTGKNGIIQDNDTPDSASDKLTPFAVAGNLEALYM